MSRIITLTGPSQSGKSTTIDYFLSTKMANYKPQCIPKYTTRAPRSDDKPREVIHCEILPMECDLVYQQYDNRYGLQIDSIVKNLEKGITSIIVLNDVRTITEVKRIFGKLCNSVFVYRSSPNLQQFENISAKRGVLDKANIQRRLKKAEAIYRIYIENINLFDNVIINAYGRRELKKQVRAIVGSINSSNFQYFK